MTHTAQTLTRSDISLAKAMAERMIKDNVTPEQYAANSEALNDAYMAAQRRSHEKMVNAFLTIPAARTATIAMVAEVLS